MHHFAKQEQSSLKLSVKSFFFQRNLTQRELKTADTKIETFIPLLCFSTEVNISQDCLPSVPPLISFLNGPPW